MHRMNYSLFFSHKGSMPLIGETFIVNCNYALRPGSGTEVTLTRAIFSD